MRPNVATALGLGLFLATSATTTAAPALAQEGPSREQVVAEVSRVSGLAADVVAQALDDNPAWMEQLGNAVSVAETVDKLLSGKDTEVVTDFVTGRLTDWAESFIEKALPAELTGFIGAVKVYKDALEYIRDNAFVPALHARVYDEFKRARGGRTNYTFANPTEAFIQAIYNVFGPGGGAEFKGYWPQYDAQYARLLESEGYNPDLVGEKLKKHLKRRLDRFWAERLEVAYRQELLKPEKESLIETVWASVQDTLALLVPAGIDATLFIDPASELPQGWWWVSQGTVHTAGTVAPMSVESGLGPYWMQRFHISAATDFALRDGKRWCRESSCKMPYAAVWVWIAVPRSITPQDYLESSLGDGQMQRLSDRAAWSQDGEYTNLIFVLGSYSVHIRLRRDEETPAGLDLAKHFGRVIAGKLKARIESESADQ